jgi:hypothetical protein
VSMTLSINCGLVTNVGGTGDLGIPSIKDTGEKPIPDYVWISDIVDTVRLINHFFFSFWGNLTSPSSVLFHSDLRKANIYVDSSNCLDYY